MSHDYHEGLPGFHPEQLFHDGCHECERRAHDFEFARLDLRAAWHRAYWFEKSSERPSDFGPVSEAEAPILRLLWTLMVRMQRDGIGLGLYPGDLIHVIRSQGEELGTRMLAAPLPLIDAILQDNRDRPVNE